MVILTSKQKPPPSTDVPAWRAIAAAGGLGHFAAEEVIAAFQDAGGRDPRLREMMASYLSAMVYRVLRRRVGRNKIDDGRDIIDDIHDGFFAANCRPASTDAKGYRQAFVTRIMFRMKDALAGEKRSTVIEARRDARPNDGSPLGALALVPEIDEVESDAYFEREELSGDGVQRPAPDLLAEVEVMTQQLDVTRILAKVPDYRKRLAFRLFMDQVPVGGNKPVTIARTLGVDRKTIEHWIAEVREFLKTQVPEVQTLQRRPAGE